MQRHLLTVPSRQKKNFNPKLILSHMRSVSSHQNPHHSPPLKSRSGQRRQSCTKTPNPNQRRQSVRQI